MVAPAIVSELGWKTHIVWTCTNFRVGDRPVPVNARSQEVDA